MYRASSIVQAIKESGTAKADDIDLVVCPVSACYVKPEDCSNGKAQKCKKTVYIHYEHDNHNKMVALIFRFMVSETDRDGFILKDDFALKLLIRRKIVDESRLIAA
jgi:hypothetical protein